MNIRFNTVDWSYFFITLIFFLLGIADFVFGDHQVLSICVLLINITFIIKFHKKIPLFILFSFFFLYSKIFPLFFIQKNDISYWADFQTTSALGTVLITHFLFLFFLGNSISHKSDRRHYDILQIVKPRFSWYIMFCISAMLILIFGLSGENMFKSGTYANSEVVQKSTLHEYFIVIFLFIIIYAPRGFLYKIITYLFLTAFIIKTLLYGGRIEVLQISLMFFYIYYVLKNKVRLRYVIILMLGGVYLSGLVSNIRSNPLIILSDDYFALFNPAQILFPSPERNIISSTEGDVVQSSARMIGLLQIGEIDFVQRGISFFSYLMSPIVPPSLLPGVSNLATYKQDLYHSGGGGLISSFFFIWLGYAGPVLIALVIGFLIRKFYEFQNRLYIIYGICILSMFPRWFSYNPIFIVKFCLYSVMLFILINLAEKLAKKFVSYHA